MNTKLHVDNLTTATTESELRALFGRHGEVVGVHLPMDRASGRSRGFGFVTMSTPEGAQSAIQFLTGKALGDRILTVSAAWPQEQDVTSPAEPGLG
jgi:cold-inducible RNA-binding protein